MGLFAFITLGSGFLVFWAFGRTIAELEDALKRCKCHAKYGEPWKIGDRRYDGRTGERIRSKDPRVDEVLRRLGINPSKVMDA